MNPSPHFTRFMPDTSHHVGGCSDWNFEKAAKDIIASFYHPNGTVKRPFEQETFIASVAMGLQQAFLMGAAQERERCARIAETSCFYLVEKPDLEIHDGTGCDIHHKIIATAIHRAAPEPPR